MRAAYRKKWPEQVDSIYRRPQEVKDWREAYTAPHRTKSHQLSFRLTVGPQCRVQLPPPSTSSFVPINLLFPKEAWQWKNHKQQLETRKSRIMDEWRNWLCSSNKHMRVHNTHTHTSGFQEVRPNLGKGKSHKSEVLILDWTGPFNTWSKITRKKSVGLFWISAMSKENELEVQVYRGRAGKNKVSAYMPLSPNCMTHLLYA